MSRAKTAWLVRPANERSGGFGGEGEKKEPGRKRASELAGVSALGYQRVAWRPNDICWLPPELLRKREGAPEGTSATPTLPTCPSFHPGLYKCFPHYNARENRVSIPLTLKIMAALTSTVQHLYYIYITRIRELYGTGGRWDAAVGRALAIRLPLCFVR